MSEIPSPPLKGRKALVLGIANEHSIAYGCARAFRKLGAELAITYLNDKARPHVEPLARELEAPIFERMDVQQARPDGSRVRPRPADLGPPGHRAARHRVRPEGRPAGGAAQLFGGGL